jgi:DNA-binding NarL/FixJ family response regulator
MAAGTVAPCVADDVRPDVRPDELAILELLAAGRTIAQVAEELHFSRRTVERRLTQLRSCLDATTNQSLVARARELRLV